MSETTQDNQPPHTEPSARVEPLNEHELALIKNGKRYVFECPPGQEAQTLNQIAEMVTRENSDLNWFDAAVLSHQLGERMSKRLSEINAPGTDGDFASTRRTA